MFTLSVCLFCPWLQYPPQNCDGTLPFFRLMLESYIQIVFFLQLLKPLFTGYGRWWGLILSKKTSQLKWNAPKGRRNIFWKIWKIPNCGPFSAAGALKIFYFEKNFFWHFLIKCFLLFYDICIYKNLPLAGLLNHTYHFLASLIWWDGPITPWNLEVMMFFFISTETFFISINVKAVLVQLSAEKYKLTYVYTHNT
jgi:hypothetical protein